MMNHKPALSNETLLRMWYGGNKGALGVLFVRMWSQLLRVALRYLPPRLPARAEVAEDLVAEAFVKVLNTQRDAHSQFRFQSGNTVLKWIPAIVRNHVATFRRTKKNGRAVPMSFLEPLVDEGEVATFESTIEDHRQGEPHEELEDWESRQQLGAAVRRLPQQDQIILFMRVKEAKSLQEIATAIDVSPSTVCRRLRDIGASIHGQIQELPVRLGSLEGAQQSPVSVNEA